jgi:hypothetical protein
VLTQRDYLYDASTFPTYLGPLARAYYFMTANLSDDDMEKRKELFGNFSDGFRPLKPYRLHIDDSIITEIPVTTMPLIKVPIHVSYLLYLSHFSRPLAKLYFKLALEACRVMGTGISLLLHPLDFLGCDDTADLAFFPGMNMPAARKIELVDNALHMLEKRFEVVTMQQHASRVAGSSKTVEATLNKRKLVM